MGSIHRQVIIAGAGIAGLWTLRRLLAAGYDAILLERDAIGAGQTLGAQGILHGGVKYGLDGSNRDIAAELSVATRTVELRLTRSYRKLGIRGRAELAELLTPAHRKR